MKVKRQFLVVVAAIIAPCLLLTSHAAPNPGKIQILWGHIPKVELVQDIFPGPNASDPRNLTVWNHELWFAAAGDASGSQLWKYDARIASSAVASGVLKNSPIEHPRHSMRVFNGDLYYAAQNFTVGDELYRRSALSPDLELFDINPDNESSEPRWLTLYDGALYFAADDGGGRKLMKYDGWSQPEPVMVPWPVGGGTGPISDPRYLTVFDQNLFFLCNNDLDGTSGSGIGFDLWKYNPYFNPSEEMLFEQVGDISGVDDVPNEPEPYFIEYNQKFYFMNLSANFQGLFEYQPYQDNKIKPITGDFIKPSHPVVFRNKLYFAAEDENGNEGRELWKYDNRPQIPPPPSVAAEIPGAEELDPREMTFVNPLLYFSANDAALGRGLYTLGGSEAVKVAAQDPNNDASDPRGLTLYQGLYFSAESPGLLRELWRCRRVPDPDYDPFFYIRALWDLTKVPASYNGEVDHSAGTVGFLAFAEGATPRLLARRSVNLDDPRQSLYESPPLDPKQFPPSMALVIVLMHDGSGRMVAAKTKIVDLKGKPDSSVSKRLRAQAKSFVNRLKVNELQRMKVKEFDVASQSVGEKTSERKPSRSASKPTRPQSPNPLRGKRGRQPTGR